MARSTLEVIIQLTKKGGGDKDTIRGLNDVKRAWTSVLGVVGGVTAAYALVDKALDMTLGKYLTATERVRGFTAATGASAEAASRFADMADDLGVGAETMQKALAKAVRNGLDPTIDGLMRSVDQYQSLGSAQEKAKYLNDLYGKSGQEVAKIYQLGSAAVEEYYNGLSEGLVITEEDIRVSLELAAAKDELNQSMETIQVTAGRKVAPVMVALTRETNNFVRSLDGLMSMLGGDFDRAMEVWTSDDRVTRVQEGWESYTRWATAMYNASQQNNLALSDMTDEFDFLLKASKAYTESSREIAELEAQIADARAAGTTGEALDGLLSQLDEAKAKSQELANQMVLDFYKMQLAADGVITQEELESYFGLAEAMGLTDQNATNAALALLAVAQAVGGMPDSKVIDIYIQTHGGNVVAGMSAYQQDVASDAAIRNRGGRYGETIDFQELRPYAAGGVLGKANVVGERGWEAILQREDGSFVVIPHDISRFLMEQGLLPVAGMYGGGGPIGGSKRALVNSLVKGGGPSLRGGTMDRSGNVIYYDKGTPYSLTDAGVSGGGDSSVSAPAAAASAAAEAVAPLVQNTMATFTASQQQNSAQVSQQTQTIERTNQDMINEQRATRRAVEALAEQLAAEIQKNR